MTYEEQTIYCYGIGKLNFSHNPGSFSFTTFSKYCNNNIAQQFQCLRETNNLSVYGSSSNADMNQFISNS